MWHGHFREGDHVTCLGHGGVNRLGERRGDTGRHVLGHRQVELVRAAQHAEAAVARVMVGELHRHCQEGGPYIATHAAVLQLRVPAAVGYAIVAGDGAAVQAEALGVTILSDHLRLVVHSVAFPTDRGQIRNQLRVSQHVAKEVAVWLSMW